MQKTKMACDSYEIALIRQREGEAICITSMPIPARIWRKNSSWAMSGALTITGGLVQESMHRNQMPQMPQAQHIWVRSAAIRSMNQQENSVLPPFCIIGAARSISFCDHLFLTQKALFHSAIINHCSRSDLLSFAFLLPFELPWSD